MSFVKKIKLCLMMFLQFMLVATFWVQLSAYLDSVGITGTAFALIMSTMAIGSVFSPIVGMFADKVANSEKVLFVLNVLVALFLLAAFYTSDPTMIFIWLLLAMCAYMPTWGLTSSIAMANSTTESFPVIRVFGSIGWVCAAVFALCADWFFGKMIDGTSIPFACAAGVAIAAALLALCLPPTPPSGKDQKFSLVDALGLRAFSLLKDKNMAIFMLCVVIWTVAFTIYWMYASFLTSLGVQKVTPVLNIGQVSEVLFMLLLPISIKFWGIKPTMAIGIAAMVLRYVLSALTPEIGGLYYGAIAVHGIIFGFFFVAAQMYVAKKAPKSLEAQAQGLYFFFYGIAQIAGTFFSKWLIDTNTQQIVSTVASAVGTSASRATDWETIFYVEAAISAVLLVVWLIFFKDDTKKVS